MIDAVDSGGFGVLGLYAARAPVVPEPPASPPAVGSPVDSAGAAQAATSIQGHGSGPLAAADPGADGSASQGRDFGDSAQGQARQTTVLTALVAASGAARNGAAGGSATSSATSSASAAPASRALRAYSRAGTSVASGNSSGIMVARRT